MAKKKEPKRNKIQKVSEIDRIPKCWKQPRSTGGPRRRRTDFSLFFCSSSSSLSYSPLGVLLESLRGKDKSGCDTITDSEETRKKREEILQFPAVQCCDFEDLRQESFSNFTGVPLIEVEQVNQNTPFDSWSGRNAEKQESDTVGKLEFTPEKSQITESTSLCKTPGSSVGDKTACQLWSAEVSWGQVCSSTTTRNDYLIISEAYYIYILFGNLSVPSKCQSIQVGNRSKTSFEEPKL